MACATDAMIVGIALMSLVICCTIVSCIQRPHPCLGGPPIEPIRTVAQVEAEYNIKDSERKKRYSKDTMKISPGASPRELPTRLPAVDSNVGGYSEELDRISSMRVSKEC